MPISGTVVLITDLICIAAKVKRLYNLLLHL